jgi:hypothetical protein
MVLAAKTRTLGKTIRLNKTLLSFASPFSLCMGVVGKEEREIVIPLKDGFNNRTRRGDILLGNPLHAARE